MSSPWWRLHSKIMIVIVDVLTDSFTTIDFCVGASDQILLLPLDNSSVSSLRRMVDFSKLVPSSD